MRECDYCLRERYYHGGKCNGKWDSKPCLLFEKDSRGCPKHVDNIKFKVSFGTEIPVPGKPNNDWTIAKIRKTITVTKIHKVEWDTDAKGLRGITLIADLWYWSEENGELPPERPKLKLIKG
jgi:hypothetical protein